MRRITHILSLSLLTAWGSFSASASIITLTFEGLQDNEAILNYYNGGTGSLGSGPGPNYGVVFGADSLALISQQNGGSGNFTGSFAPSPSTTGYFLTGPGDVMNVAAGFTTGFSFFYTSPFYTGSVTVWSGLDGTGTLLATLTLGLTPNTSGLPGHFGHPYDGWTASGVTFSGTAESAIFSGTANLIGFDNITLGSEIPVGVPDGGATALLLGIGSMSLVGFRRFVRMA